MANVEVRMFAGEMYHSKFESRNSKFTGAGDETRTRDPQLGRLMLYQLSYSREGNAECRMSSAE